MEMKSAKMFIVSPRKLAHSTTQMRSVPARSNRGTDIVQRGLPEHSGTAVVQRCGVMLLLLLLLLPLCRVRAL